MSETEIIPAEKLLSNKLTILPIMGHPVFPGIFSPLMINNPDDVKAVEEAFNGDSLIGVIMVKDESDEPTAEDLYSV